MSELELIAVLVVGTARAATPLLLAALGELIAERAGVLNLGVEGMMLVGAVAGFAAMVASSSLVLGFAAALLAGMLLSLVFAVLTQTLLADQVASGLALTLFGVGLSAFAGLGYLGTPISGLGPQQ